MSEVPSEDRKARVGWVSGKVIDSVGCPVRGALVDVLQPREVPEAGVLPNKSARRAVTGPRGKFRVRQAKQPYLVQICVPDAQAVTACRETAQGVEFLQTYVGPAGVTDSWVTQTALFVPDGSGRALGRVTVKPPSSVRGRLVGGADREVRIMRLNDTQAFRTGADAEGRFTFLGMAPGRYYLAAGGDGRLPWRSAEFSLRENSTLSVNGRLRRGAAIVGHPISRGEPVPGTDVLVSRVGDGIIAAATADARGRFTVEGLDVGRYRVGILYDGGDFERAAVSVTVNRSTGTHRADVHLRRGAVVSVPLVDPRGGKSRIRDELRDAQGTPLQVNRNDGRRVTYTGVRPGTYTVVAATAAGYGMRTIEITERRTYSLAPLRLLKPTLTLHGTTAPHAVAEATTGNLCPPDGEKLIGGFHGVERADAQGRYALTGLVPGMLMLGADGWPRNYAPRCWPGYVLAQDAEVDLPLVRGSTARGRLVYESTGTPVITTLSYEFSYPPGSDRNPTTEHPTRARTFLGTGEFVITRMGTARASVTGSLASEANFDEITDLRFAVIHPYQDGTPYWLSTDDLALDLGEGDEVDLGDIAVVVNPS